MDLKKRLVFFTRIIRVLAYAYLVTQYILVRDRYNPAYVVPVIVGLGVFYILMDRIVFRVPEERFKVKLKLPDSSDSGIFGEWIERTSAG